MMLLSSLDAVLKRILVNAIFGVIILLILITIVMFGYFINKQAPKKSNILLDKQPTILQSDYEN